MKIPFLDYWFKIYWFKIYWWTPEMDFGYHKAIYDGFDIYAVNLYLFSIEWVTYDAYMD